MDAHAELQTVAGVGRIVGKDPHALVPIAIEHLFDSSLAALAGVDGALETIIDRLCFSLAVSKPVGLATWAEREVQVYGPTATSELVSAAAFSIAQSVRTHHIDHGRLLTALEVLKGEVERVLAPMRDTATSRPQIAAESVTALLSVLSEHDHATCSHSRATGEWARRLGEAMRLSGESVEFVEQCAILHDIGKVTTPSHILSKTGPLTDLEWVIMHEHPAAGARILESIPTLAQFAPIVRAHHERWDGRGYPDRLAGTEIPLEARIVAVADAFHAMISTRPYRKAIAPRQALNLLSEGRGTQWDAEVVDAMHKLFKTVCPPAHNVAGSSLA